MLLHAAAVVDRVAAVAAVVAAVGGCLIIDENYKST